MVGEMVQPQQTEAVDIARADKPEPSSRHLVIGDLAVLGALIAGYLALYELGISQAVWDPLFGDGSRKVLTSSISNALPVPDAVLGFLTYAVEAVLAFAIGLGYARASGPAGGLLCLVVLGLAGAGVVLIGVQLFVVHALCTLCLASAAVSFASVAVSIPDLRTWAARLRRGHAAETPLARTRGAS
jgi:uncharacterized membrane protein